MDLHFLSGFSPVLLGNGNLGGRVATAFKSVRISISACVCVTFGVTRFLFGMFPFDSRGRDGRFPSHANEAMEIDWMEVWTQTSVPAVYTFEQLFAVTCVLLVHTTYHLLATASNLRRWPPTSLRWPLTKKRWPLTYYLSLLFCLCILPTTY